MRGQGVGNRAARKGQGVGNRAARKGQGVGNRAARKGQGGYCKVIIMGLTDSADSPVECTLQGTISLVERLLTATTSTRIGPSARQKTHHVCL